MHDVPEFGTIPVGDELERWWAGLTDDDRAAWLEYRDGPLPTHLSGSLPEGYAVTRGGATYPDPTLAEFVAKRRGA